MASRQTAVIVELNPANVARINLDAGTLERKEMALL